MLQLLTVSPACQQVEGELSSSTQRSITQHPNLKLKPSPSADCLVKLTSIILSLAWHINSTTVSCEDQSWLAETSENIFSLLSHLCHITSQHSLSICNKETRSLISVQFVSRPACIYETECRTFRKLNNIREITPMYVTSREKRSCSPCNEGVEKRTAERATTQCATSVCWIALMSR